MSTYKIISDSSCDLDNEIILKNDLDIVPFYVSFDGEKYLRDRVDISNTEFYNKITKEKLFAKTSLPSIQDYVDVFTKWLEKGLDILCICITSKFSGSYQSAINAKQLMEERYPERIIEVIDSATATACQGLVVLSAIKLRSEGKTVSETAQLIEEAKMKSKIVFTVDTLEYLQRGGRIGKVSALAGTLLNIKPIICLEDGELFPTSKLRGRKKAIAEIFEILKSDIGENSDSYIFCVVHSTVDSEIQYALSHLKELFNFTEDIPIIEVGITVGAHLGDTALGIAYFPKLYL